VLTLTESQVELLTAMNAPINTQIAKGKVWVKGRPYKITDLYALRAARLVRPAELRIGVRGYHRFELTDDGVAEAQHRSSQADASA
jgi:hypothetical protein